MRVLPVTCLSDNYAYLVTTAGSNEAVVVDPSEAPPILEALTNEGLKLVAILNTHHHWDHVGGNEELLSRLGELPVYAYATDVGRVPKQTERVEDGVPFEIAGLTFHPLHVPGHTLGAVAYHTGDAVFTGDTLFVAGCGRLFEGTPQQMFTSLTGKLGKLPPETRVFCGHEYAYNNLRFALQVEPDNEAIRTKLELATERRGEPMVPSTIAEELATNPFLRCEEPAVRERFPAPTPAEVLGAVRKAKDSFR
jgi:hydroxyacylglutathione hydrolase